MNYEACYITGLLLDSQSTPRRRIKNDLLPKMTNENMNNENEY